MYRITFTSGLEGHELGLRQRVVQTLLMALTSIDADYLSERPTPILRDLGLRLVQNPPDIEAWHDIPTCLERGILNEKDALCWRAAEERVRLKQAVWPRIDASFLSRIDIRRITIVLNLFRGPHEQDLSHRALQTLLVALTSIDRDYLLAHPETAPIYDSGVSYKEEPQGQEDWQDISTSLRMRIADCEDLACWRAAELQVRYGVMAWPTFTWKVRPSGGYLYHITVRHPDGQIECPSRRLGMR